MKFKALFFMWALGIFCQAQVPSSFFGMNSQLTGPANNLTLQYPEATLSTVDSVNFTNFTAIGTLGHPTTFAWGWVEKCDSNPQDKMHRWK
jgi:hypothetical protein